MSKVILLVISKQRCKIIFPIFILLLEVELLLITWCIAEAQMVRDGTLPGSRYHGEGRAQLTIKIFFQTDNHYVPFYL